MKLKMLIKEKKFWILYQLLRLSYWKHAMFFNGSLADVEAVQKRMLFRILKKNMNTEFGKKYGFPSIQDIYTYKKKIPISTFDDYQPFIKSIIHGKTNVLTKDPVLILEPSSGSVAPSKLIPYTRSLREEFHRALAPWIFDMLSKRKMLLKGASYWSITPVTQDASNIQGNIRIGFRDDSEYFGFIERYLVNHMLAVPKEVSQLKDIPTFKYVTLLFLLKEKNLRFISVWNPSFLTLLLDSIDEWKVFFINDIERGTITSPTAIFPPLNAALIKMMQKDVDRAQELRKIFQYHKIQAITQDESAGLYKKIWPYLTLISCWVDGNAKESLNELQRRLPHIEIQPKGLIATEGIISFPSFGEQGCLLAVNSHFFEFIEIDDPQQIDRAKINDTKLAHELEVGKNYSIIITTGGGLYRYRLHDIVKVVGFKKHCPLVKFISKEDKVVDLYGEKLNELHVTSVLEEAFAKYKISPSFFILAPDREGENRQHRYTLFIQLLKPTPEFSDMLMQLSRYIEEKLKENYHYNYCRGLGQLQPLGTFLITPNSNPEQDYIYHCNKRGQRLGNIKPSVIDSDLNWAGIFQGSFISDKFPLYKA